ncbi:MAG: hypothetical protein J1E97_03895 [Muribaculaceae bacterium]|nr:hypothetical protein [Muribaculaceae bacterium]
MKRRKHFPKSIWLPLTLLIYAGAFSGYFGPRLIREGMALKFWISVGVELIFIVGLYFALRRKEKLSRWREEE